MRELCLVSAVSALALGLVGLSGCDDGASSGRLAARGAEGSAAVAAGEITLHVEGMKKTASGAT